MKQRFYLILTICLVVSCQQKSLINLRNLELVEQPKSDATSESKAPFREIPDREDITTNIEYEYIAENTTDAFVENDALLNEQSQIEEFSISDPTPELIEVDYYELSPVPHTAQDTTKTPDNKMSKKNAGVTLGIFGGISLALFLFFFFLALLGVAVVIVLIAAIIYAFVL